MRVFGLSDGYVDSGVFGSKGPLHIPGDLIGGREGCGWGGGGGGPCRLTIFKNGQNCMSLSTFFSMSHVAHIEYEKQPWHTSLSFITSMPCVTNIDPHVNFKSHVAVERLGVKSHIY